MSALRKLSAFGWFVLLSCGDPDGGGKSASADTARVVDKLRGLKENVIMGRLIPAGTGFDYYRKVKIAEDDTIPVRVNEDEKAMQELTADLFALREKIGADDEDEDDDEDLDDLPPLP